MPEPAEPVVLVASSEFTLKSWPVRRTLEQRLIDDLRFTLARNHFKGVWVERDSARLVIHGLNGLDGAKAAAELCRKVFGVAYAAPATLVPASIDAVVHWIIRLAREDLEAGQTFAVRAHRSASSPLSRREIELKGGSEVLRAMKGKQVSVDLENPNVTFHVDLTEPGAYVYDQRLHGPEGLPLSAQWRMLAVMDSGSLSILAAYAMMRRGCLVELFIPVSSTIPAFVRESQFALARKLRDLVTRPSYRLFTLNLDTSPVAIEPRETWRSLSLGEFIRSVAMKVAKEKNFKGIIFADVAGEIGGKEKLLSANRDFPIFTPLIGLDHSDLMELAEFVNVEESGLSFDMSPVRGKISMNDAHEGFEEKRVEEVLL